MPYKLIPTFQSYDWGDDSFIQNFCSLEDREGTPLAEMWLGAHPKAPSLIQMEEKQIPLDSYLAARNEKPLLFLFKVLAAKEPLSIQVHPDKATAELGYKEENDLGINLNDPKRSFKDTNHKPELICALTDFTALCGFRAYTEIIDNLVGFKLNNVWDGFAAFAETPNPFTLKTLFQNIMRSDEAQLQETIHRIIHSAPHNAELKDICLNLINKYRYDAGVVSPLLLNLVKLKAFDAIYIEAGVLHAYLGGAGLELMANSDNVIRGGLSPKHIDLPRLFSITRFHPYSTQWVPIQKLDEYVSNYLTPEFSFSILELTGSYQLPSRNQSTIILCLHGTFSCGNELILSCGEAAFVDASEQGVTLNGKSLIAIAGALSR